MKSKFMRPEIKIGLSIAAGLFLGTTACSSESNTPETASPRPIPSNLTGVLITKAGMVPDHDDGVYLFKGPSDFTPFGWLPVGAKPFADCVAQGATYTDTSREEPIVSKNWYRVVAFSDGAPLPSPIWLGEGYAQAPAGMPPCTPEQIAGK